MGSNDGTGTDDGVETNDGAESNHGTGTDDGIGRRPGPAGRADAPTRRRSTGSDRAGNGPTEPSPSDSEGSAAAAADRHPTDSGSGTRVEPVEESWTVRRTRRWRGVVAVVLFAVAVGVLAARPAVLLVAAVGVAFAAYPHLTGAPEPELSVARRVHPDSPAPGDTVEVTTSVRNEGEAPLFDVRFVDGVPPTLSVESGTPRRATALGPGEAATVSYSLEVDRATHRFRPATVLVRDPSGGVELEASFPEETTIESEEAVPDVPLRERSRHRAGQLVTDEGGSGLEFHRTREYEPGDPVNRIDWRTFARTGELTSVEFREERLAEVVVCVDARSGAYRARSPEEPHALAYGVGAAGRIAEALFASDHRVGLAAFGPELCWLPPDSGPGHEEHFRRRLASDPALDAAPGRGLEPGGVDGPAGVGERPGRTGDAAVDRQLSTLRSQLGGETQVVLLTPLCDAESSRAAQLFESAGCAVTVVSVDVTTEATVGGRLARLERVNRVHALRDTGVPVVDWDPDRRLGTALESARWWRS